MIVHEVYVYRHDTDTDNHIEVCYGNWTRGRLGYDAL